MPRIPFPIRAPLAILASIWLHSTPGLFARASAEDNEPSIYLNDCDGTIVKTTDTVLVKWVKSGLDGDDDVQTRESPDGQGTIWVEWLGRISVVDRSMREIQAEVSKRGKNAFSDSVAFVTTERTARSPETVTIDGAVPFPREIDIGAGLTLKESIVKCGGLLPVASRRNIHLVRGSEVIKLNLKFERDADFVLLPGDKVHVPAKLF